MLNRIPSTKQAHSQFAPVSKMVYIHDLAPSSATAEDSAHASTTVRLLQDTMCVHPICIGVLSAACSALNVIIEEQPNCAQFFTEHGGAELVLSALRAGQKASDMVSVQIMARLLTGSSSIILSLYWDCLLG